MMKASSVGTTALGMLAAPRGRQLLHSVPGLIEEQTDAQLTSRLQALAAQGRAELVEEGVKAAAITSDFSLDMRYRGQSYTLNIPYRAVHQALEDFHAAHQRRFGHRLQAPVELVNLRVSLAAKHGDFGLQTGWQAPAGKPFERAELADCERLVDVWQRHELAFDTPCAGPAVIIDAVATTYVAPEWQALRDPSGCLLLERL